MDEFSHDETAAVKQLSDWHCQSCENVQSKTTVQLVFPVKVHEAISYNRYTSSWLQGFFLYWGT